MSQKESQKISTFGSRATSTVSVSLVLFLLGLGAMVAVAARGLAADLRASTGLTLSLARTAAPADIADLRVAAAADVATLSTYFISADSILAAETRAMGVAPALEPGVNPYSPELEIKVKPAWANADSLAVLAARYADLDIVEDVADDGAVLHALDGTMARIAVILYGLAAVLLVVSIVLISNTVSLSIYSRRFGIHTMRLVGATAGFIRRPFVRAGAVNGLIAGLIAAGVLCALRAYAATLEPAADELLPWWVMAIIGGATVVVGILLCAVTSYFATNRYLAKNYDELFLK